MNGKTIGIESLLVTLLLLLIAITQYYSDLNLRTNYRNRQINQIPALAVPSAAAVKKTDLGFHRASADLLWLRTIQYFGGGNPNEPYSSLYPLLTTVVELDPTFTYPYLFGGLILPWQNEPQQALTLLEKGIRYHPNNGLMYYYAGSIAKIQLNDSPRSAWYFQNSIGKEDTPKAAAVLAGISLSESDNREFALQWWQSIIDDDSQSVVIKERAKVWGEHLRLVLDLEKMITEVNQHTNQPITSLDDLVTRGILTELPRSPLGFALRYDPITSRVEQAK